MKRHPYLRVVTNGRCPPHIELLWPRAHLVRSVCRRCGMLAVLPRVAWQAHLLACIPASQN